MCATPPATCRARRCPKAAGCMCRRPTTPARWRMKQRCWPANSARRSSRGRPTGCARRCIRRAIFTGCIIRAASACIRSIMRSVLPPRPKPPAPASSRTRRCWRSIRRACASASSRSHSRVRAAHVVLAGNVHLTELVPQFAEHAVADLHARHHHRAARRRVAGCHPLSRRGERQPICAGHHHRVVDGRRLMWSGQSSVWLGKPQRHADALIRQIRRTYPALRGVKAEYAWIGVAGHTVHGMPQIGEITPGLWLLGGFGGHGLNTTAMGGEMRRARHRRGRPRPGRCSRRSPWSGPAARSAAPRSRFRLVAPLARDDRWRAGAPARREAQAPARAATQNGRDSVAAGRAGGAVGAALLRRTVAPDG